MHEATRQSSDNIIADIYDAPRWRKVVGEPSLGLGRIGLEYCVDAWNTNFSTKTFEKYKNCPI